METSRNEGSKTTEIALPLTVTVTDGHGEVIFEEVGACVMASVREAATQAWVGGKLVGTARCPVMIGTGSIEDAVRMLAHVLSAAEAQGVRAEVVFGYYVAAVRHGLNVEIGDIADGGPDLPPMPFGMGFGPDPTVN